MMNLLKTGIKSMKKSVKFMKNMEKNTHNMVINNIIKKAK